MTPFDKKQISKMPFGLQKLRNLILRKMMLYSMEKADIVIFISKFAELCIKDTITKPLKKTILIPHGVDFNKVKEFKTINEVTDLPFILYASSLDIYKSQLEVIEAYSILAKKRDLPNLLLVGSVKQNREYVKQVKEKILRLGLTKKVILTGKIDYELMPSIYNRAELVIFASQTENCPNILLEAMASKKFIICSNNEPMPEFAKDTVVYFDPVIPEDLSDKLNMALSNPEILTSYAAKAFEESKNYSWKNTSKQTWDSLTSIL